MSNATEAKYYGYPGRGTSIGEFAMGPCPRCPWFVKICWSALWREGRCHSLFLYHGNPRQVSTAASVVFHRRGQDSLSGFETSTTECQEIEIWEIRMENVVVS